MRNNVFIFLYVIISILLEFFATFLVSNELKISRPGIFLTLIALATAILCLIPDQKTRFWLSAAFMIAHALIDLTFILMYTLTSGTIFDFEMFNLAKDGMGTIEATSPNFAFLFVSCFVIGLYIVLGNYEKDRAPLVQKKVSSTVVISILLCVIFAAQGTLAYFVGRN